MYALNKAYETEHMIRLPGHNNGVSKKMNTSKKGWRKERECRRLLEAEGWLIVFKSIRWKWGTLDFAKLFDTVAVRNTITLQEPKLEWLFISNKHFNGRYLPHQEEIKNFKEAYGTEDMVFQLWLWHKPKWVGRGKDKHWQNSKWEIISL